MSLLRAAAKRFEANRPPGRLLGRDGAEPPRKATRRSLAGCLGVFRGRALGNPRRRRTSRYAEHRRLGSAAVAHSRSAPTHANVRLSPNGRAGVFIRAWRAEITPLPRCREENSGHQGLPSRIKIPSRGTNVDDRCASSVGPAREHVVPCGFPP